MTRVKKITAILSAILLIGTIIYQVNAYEGYDQGNVYEGYDLNAEDSVVIVDDEVEEGSEIEGDYYGEDDYLPEGSDDSGGITSLPGDLYMDEDETELVEDDELETEEGYMGIEPAISTPPYTAVSFMDITAGTLKHVQVHVPTLSTPDSQLGISIAPDVIGVFDVGGVEQTVLIGDIIPENWEVLSWSVIYNTNQTGIREFLYTTMPFGDQLIHTLPEDICLVTDWWVMLPTFTVHLRPIPAVLSGTVTCVTCPEENPGLPMPGVTIRLYDNEGDFVRSEITNEDGFFDFGVVPFGEFELVKEVETVPEGHLSIEPRTIDLTIATPAGVYEEHFFVECKAPPSLGKEATLINGEPIEEGQLVVEGDIITYLLRVNNPNPRPWTNFLVVDELPAGLTLVGDVEVTPASALVEDESTSTGVRVVIDLPPGPGTAGNVDIVFDARVDDVALAVDGYFVNVATLYGPPENGGERPPVDCDDEDVPARPPGVSIVKVVSEQEAEPGETLTYTLLVRNTGGAVLTNVVVTDDLPVQLTQPRNLVITPEGAGRGNFVGQLLTVNIPVLGIGEAVTITFDVTVAADVEKGTEIVNVAEVTTDQNVYDEDEETVVVDYEPEPPVLRPPGIDLEKSVSSATIEPGGTLTYTIVVRNTGDSVLTNVIVTDNLPVQLTDPRNLVITPPGAGTGSFVGQLLTVNIPVLGINETVIIVFDVTVAEDVANNTTIRNVASVTTDEGPSDEDDTTTTVTFEPPTEAPPQPPYQGRPPGQAPRTGDIGVLETTLFMFIAGATALVMFSLLKTEKKKTRRK